MSLSEIFKDMQDTHNGRFFLRKVIRFGIMWVLLHKTLHNHTHVVGMSSPLPKVSIVRVIILKCTDRINDHANTSYHRGILSIVLVLIVPSMSIYMSPTNSRNELPSRVSKKSGQSILNACLYKLFSINYVFF